MGFQSTIIPLTWPDGVDPSHTLRFESTARALRYQALGRACRDKGIKSLLLGHHADDQAETVIMRLLLKRLRSGLKGMAPIEWIPECHGIHGVYHSGDPIPRGDPMSPYLEHGGIQILRPLLDFQKRRLIATCEKHHTRWAEDKTNQDKTLASRNAIRHIVNNHQLPKALSTESIVAVAKNTRSRLENHEAAAEALFNSCRLKIDIQTGALAVRFPPVEAFFAGHTVNPSSSETLQARNTAQILLRRVVEIICPKERAMQESIANAVLNIYPSLAEEDRGHYGQATSFTSSWCLWTNLNPPTAPDHSARDPSAHHTNEWLISRQPLYGNKESQTLIFAPNQRSDWQLFDGRFWVRVHNRADRPIVMRTITDSQLEGLSQTDPKNTSHGDPSDVDTGLYISQKGLRSVLDAIKPHCLRRSLPALFLTSADANKDATPTLLAFPTLQTGPVTSDNGHDSWECKWEVRYKKIDPGKRALSTIVRKPVQHSINGDTDRERTRARYGHLSGRKILPPNSLGRDDLMTQGEKKARDSKKRQKREEKKRAQWELLELRSRHYDRAVWR